jgi:hypothetical protein
MNTLFKFICAVSLTFLFFAFISCKKEIKEPTNFGNGKTKLYIKVDDTEYLFEDKNFNIYKNTRGDFKIISADFFENSFGINLECKFKLLFDKKNRDKYYYSFCNIKIDPYNVIAGQDYFIPSLFNIKGNFYNNSEMKMPIGLYIQHNPPYNSPSNLSYTTDTIFKLLNYSFDKKEFAFEYKTEFKNNNDTNQIKSIHSLKIILNYKHEN